MENEGHSPDYWRNRADLVRAMVKKTRDSELRGHLMEIAASYERLAELAAADRAVYAAEGEPHHD